MAKNRNPHAAKLARHLFLGVVLACFSVSDAWTQAYPVRPVHLVVPLPPGGFPDYVARLLADRLAAPLGQTLVVDNKPGAGGNIAAEFAAR